LFLITCKIIKFKVDEKFLLLRAYEGQHSPQKQHFEVGMDGASFFFLALSELGIRHQSHIPKGGVDHWRK
jgi:hypothetical protein